MTPIILDASVVLAVVLGEKGHEGFHRLGWPLHVSTVNMAEVRCKLVDHDVPAPDIDRALGLLGLTIVEFTEEHARLSATLRRQTRHAGLSLGDRACLALATAMTGRAITADRAWMELSLPIPVECIR